MAVGAAHGGTRLRNLMAGGNAKAMKRGVLDQRVLWRQCCSIAAEMDFMDFMDFMDKVKIKSILSIRSIYCHSG